MPTWERDVPERVAAPNLIDGKRSTHRIGKSKSYCKSKSVRQAGRLGTIVMFTIYYTGIGIIFGR